ncbi:MULTISPECIES: hypothetical protein [Streptomyces]|uniref:hypothetical protein n=1 Tax=Streptomyces sp. SID5471 TaxID=2690298 RepID=UPI001E388E8E|nr:MULTISPECIES: hypothetical protein [Streptomyces]
MPVTLVTGGHPPPGVPPREARRIAEEHRTSASSPAWLGDFPQLMTFLDACTPPWRARPTGWPTASAYRAPAPWPGCARGPAAIPARSPRAVRRSTPAACRDGSYWPYGSPRTGCRPNCPR